MEHNKELMEYSLQTMYLYITYAYFGLMAYANIFEEVIVASTQNRKISIPGTSKKNTSTKTKKSKLIKTIRLTNLVSNLEEFKREYTRKTEGWNVKGFWRTYKSGKTVWVKPFIKGNMDKIERKIYKV